MKIGKIDFPEPLLSAVRNGELVVFAGAGASMGPPARLPNFRGLADSIATHTGESRSDEEAIDMFLGRLKLQGVEVHKLAADALAADSPTELHRSLLGLYRSADEVRVVTTNFDLLFEAGAADVFKVGPKVFEAPALPLGNDFAGIVHVHGSVRSLRQMVLTDDDFGRAYLTEGWARRFIVEAFRNHIVLFVGYSHEDVVLNYIARALPPAASNLRYALVGDLKDDSERWRRLGVEPVPYPQERAGEHGALSTGVRTLVAFVGRGVLDWRKEIREIAAGSPPIDEESSERLAYALRGPENAENVRFFTESARSPEWVVWLEERDFLGGLFDDGNYGEREHQFAWWLVWQFAASDSDVLRGLIARNGYRLAGGFWFRLVAWLDSDHDSPVEDGVVSTWVMLLLENLPRFGADGGSLHAVAKVCVKHARWRDLAATFEVHLARDVASLSNVPEADAEYWLEKVWTNVVQPCLDRIGEQILASSVRCLEQRQHLLEVWRPDLNGRDWSITRRLAIEEHDSNLEGREPVDVAIDAARDALAWLTVRDTRAAQHWCDRCIKSGSVALRRLAVYGISTQGFLSADASIDWLLERTDLHDLALRHEVFGAVRKFYRGATDERRKRLVERIMEFKGRPSDRNGDQTVEHVEYEKFKWLVWLENAAPGCPLVRGPLGEIRRLHPDFLPRDHPDFGMGPAESYTVESLNPWSAEEMLKQTPEQWVAALPADLPDEEFTPAGRLVDRAGGLAQEIAKAVEREPPWGLGVANALLTAGRLEEKFWPELLRALGVAEQEVLADVVGLFTRPELRTAYLRERAEVFRTALAERRSAWLEGLFPSVLAAAAVLAELSRSAELPDVAEVRRRGWMHGGLYHPAAPLAEFWLTAIEVLRKDSRPSAGLAERRQILEVLSAAVAEDSNSAAVSVAVLACQLHFLLAVEEEWTREHLLPLFDATAAGSGRAALHEAVWDGFLVAGRLVPGVAEALRPAFLEVAKSVGEFSDWKRGRFLHYLATMMVYYVDDPLAEWVPRLFKRLDEDGRVELARHIGRHVLQASPEVRSGCWRRWLKQYWRNRLNGVPAPLTQAETEAMFHWLSDLRPVFTEAVELAVRMPVFPQQRVPLAWSKLREVYPGPEYAEALARLVLHLSDHDLGIDRQNRNRLIEQLLKEELPEETNRCLKEAAVKWGA